jgi:hypothetical protein
MFSPKTELRSAATTNGGRSFPNAELPCTITSRPMCMNW